MVKHGLALTFRAATAALFAVCFLSAQTFLAAHLHNYDGDKKQTTHACTVCLVKASHNDSAVPVFPSQGLIVPREPLVAVIPLMADAVPLNPRLVGLWARGPPVSA